MVIVSTVQVYLQASDVPGQQAPVPVYHSAIPGHMARPVVRLLCLLPAGVRLHCVRKRGSVSVMPVLWAVVAGSLPLSAITCVARGLFWSCRHTACCSGCYVM